MINDCQNDENERKIERNNKNSEIQNNEEKRKGKCKKERKNQKCIEVKGIKGRNKGTKK